MSRGVLDYRDLLVWQRGMEVVSLAYTFTKRFPEHERLGLALQIRRAAISVPSNIAEGQARGSTKEFLRFISYASGSAAELETQVLAALELGYGRGAESTVLTERLIELRKMLHGLRRALQARLKRTTKPPT